jgi:hypothetical protein
MKPSRILQLALALAALALPATAGGGVGSTMPAVELEGYSLTKAKSFDEYLGRTVLIEFFAYW